VRIEGVERVHEIGGHTARPGHEFVIVDTSWKNIIPLKMIDKTASQKFTDQQIVANPCCEWRQRPSSWARFLLSLTTVSRTRPSFLRQSR
jgi:hypothetical protein